MSRRFELAFGSSLLLFAAYAVMVCSISLLNPDIIDAPQAAIAILAVTALSTLLIRLKLL